MSIPAPAGSSPKKARASSSVTARERPGATGAPSASASARARVFAPNRSSVSGRGPTNVSPASSQARAKAALSARKP